MLAFVPVGELDLFDVVDASGDEADAFALEEAPRVVVCVGVAGVFVGVVVAGAGDEGAGFEVESGFLISRRGEGDAGC